MNTNIVNINGITNQQTSKDAGMRVNGYSHNIIRIMDNIVYMSATFDNDSLSYQLDYSSLNDFHLEELTAQLFIDQPDYACEATGPDNDNYIHKMLPTLINLLKDSTSDDARFKFIEVWRDSISHYAVNTITELLEWRLGQYNYDMSLSVRSN